MQFIGETEVARALSFPVLIAAMEAAHRRPRAEILDGFLGNEAAQYVVRSAVDPGRYMASKMFTSFPANLEGICRRWRRCVLFDGRDGPAGCIDAPRSPMADGADSALGANSSPIRPRDDTVVGAGKMRGGWCCARCAPSLGAVIDRSRVGAERRRPAGGEGFAAEVTAISTRTREATDLGLHALTFRSSRAASQPGFIRSGGRLYAANPEATTIGAGAPRLRRPERNRLHGVGEILQRSRAGRSLKRVLAISRSRRRQGAAASPRPTSPCQVCGGGHLI